jgi:hypothetical protein
MNWPNKRVKLTLTRPDNPAPLSIYLYIDDIKCIVTCPCDKGCEITLHTLFNSKPSYVDNSAANRKALGIE